MDRLAPDCGYVREGSICASWTRALSIGGVPLKDLEWTRGQPGVFQSSQVARVRWARRVKGPTRSHVRND